MIMYCMLLQESIQQENNSNSHTALGTYCTTLGTYCLALGTYCTALGTYCTALETLYLYMNLYLFIWGWGGVNIFVRGCYD